MRYLAESSPRVRSRLQRQDIDLERLRIVFREDKVVQVQNVAEAMRASLPECHNGHTISGPVKAKLDVPYRTTGGICLAILGRSTFP